MPQSKDLDRRRANVRYVEATNRLSGCSVSKCMAAKIEEYASGYLSLAELLVEAKKMHSAPEPSSFSEE